MSIAKKPSNKASLLAILLLSFIAIIVFRDYLLLKHIFFFRGVGSDTINIYYAYECNLADYIAKYGVPKWSFNYGMGQNIFPFCLIDPFNFLLCACGKNYVIYGTAYKEAIKIILCGLTFFYYLKALKLSDQTSLTGSLLFAFCGFTMVGSFWNIFSFEALDMALLLLSFELLFTGRKWYLFPVVIALISISQPFNLYLYGMFIAAYALLRHIQTHTFTLKAIAVTFLKMIGLGVTGLLISAPFLIQNLIQLLNSPRGSGANSYAHSLYSSSVFAVADKLQLGTSVMRFFSTDMVGNGLEYHGWHNYLEGPLFYCGLPCLLLLPQLFPFLERRIRIAFIVFLGVWILPVIFPYLRYAFWLFTGSYYRAYSLFVAFFVLYYSLYALEFMMQKKKLNLTILIITILVLSAVLHYPFFNDKEIVVHSRALFANIMLVVYGVIFYFMFVKKVAYTQYIFIGLVVFELIHLSGITLNNMDALPASTLAQKGGYNDYTIEALNYIKPMDKSFYRIDKTYSSSYSYYPSLNDGMAQDYRGTSEYSSFNQRYYVSYLQLMGIADKEKEEESRWAVGLVGRPILEAENRVKYVLTKDSISSFRNATCDSLINFTDLKILRNRYVLPLGYTYKYYIGESDLSKLSNEQKDIVSLQACVLKDKDVNKFPGIKEFQLKDTIAVSVFNNDIYSQYVQRLSEDTLALSKFDDNLIAGRINAGEDKMMYLSVPYDIGWQLKVDGQRQDKVILDGGMTGVYLHKGPHTVEMAFELPYLMLSLLLCVAGILLYVGLCIYSIKYLPVKL